MPGEGEQRALQVGHRDALVHRQPLDLIEHPLVGGVLGLVAVAAARHDDAHRRRLGAGRLRLGDAALHHPRLHRRGVGPHQHLRRVDVEGVPHVAGRVVGRDVEHLEVVLVELDLRAFDDLVADRLEEAGDLAQDDGGRVEAAAHGRPARQRHVDALLLQRLGERLAARTRSAALRAPPPGRASPRWLPGPPPAADRRAGLPGLRSMSVSGAAPPEVGHAPLFERVLLVGPRSARRAPAHAACRFVLASHPCRVLHCRGAPPPTPPPCAGRGQAVRLPSPT